MNRGLLVLIPWMATLAAANPNGPRPAQVHFTHVEPAHERAWRIGDECWVPLTALKAYGWRYSRNQTAVEITAGARNVTVGLRPGTREELVPLREAVDKLGGISAWRPGSSTIDVFGVVERVSLEGDRLTVTSSLATKPNVFQLREPSRVVLDLTGVQLGVATQIELPPNARIGQFKESVVRITVETDQVKPPKWTDAPGTAVVVAFGENAELEVPPTGPPTEPGDTDPTVPPTNPSVATAGPLECVTEITLPGAQYVTPEPGAPVVAPFTTVETRDDGKAVIVKLTLPRPMGVSFALMPAEVQLALFKPAVGDGKLAGKLIVVDPGHGGPDTGAKSSNGEVFEKNLNLTIGKQIAEYLTAQGATVILTRKSDVKIPLKERSEIANRNGADLFVSVHINSNKLANSRSGSITFHHGGDPISNVLAECIQREIGKTNGLPSLGVWSDTRIYRSGFAVLRYAKMPAVLLELGFINHSGDVRRLSDADVQARIARAVIQGLKVYLGDAKTEEKPIE
jgi:N-acetylmuramoyl-L-alanine amidase